MAHLQPRSLIGKLSIFLLLCIAQTSFSFPHQPLSSRRLLTTTPRNIVKQYLNPHNKSRAKLGLPPLKWSNKLANYASWWGHQRQVSCELVHSRGDYGENLFWGSGKDWKPRDAVKAWAKEGPYYDYKSNSCKKNEQCLHYTQIIWKQSTRVGCAKVVCKTGDTLISCNYDPHGNVVGEKPF
ncbi:hypothetical protein K7X08_029089 [Anisodus acutangulus]|uniref:SCP domain-containing protein n=1 Tax=Anisodus acutangulus TaxID=402998 RepID=A0A9Q1L4H3_9SOLA|nr:hypothetical protein K7X08_029089 [Anisodus acutangulus]